MNGTQSSPPASTRATLAEQLNRATEGHHVEVERTLADGAFAEGRRSYASFLRGMWAFLLPIERRLLGSPSYRATVPDATKRLRAERARTDLSELGEVTVTDELPVPDTALPPMRSLTEMLGVAYAIEGLALRLRLLRWEAVHRMGLGPNQTSFLSADGAASKERWRRFLAHLEKAPVTDEERPKLMRAAASCLERLCLWLRARTPYSLP